MNKTGKEELIVTLLRKFIIPVDLGMRFGHALEITLESKEFEYAAAVGLLPKDSLKKALMLADQGGSLSEILGELDIFSEYDLQVIHTGQTTGCEIKAVEALIDFYAVTYGV